jgi:hypothetical protein
MRTDHLTGTGPLVTLDPERALIGCVLQLDTTPARGLLAGMRPDDLADPATSTTLAIVIRLLADDMPPAPAMVWHAAAHGGIERHHLERFGPWLVDTYRAAPPPTVGPHLKATVLEAAWRRAITAHATRLRQAATEAPVDVLAEVDDDRATVDRLAAHYRAARTDTITRTHLEAA